MADAAQLKVNVAVTDEKIEVSISGTVVESVVRNTLPTFIGEYAQSLVERINRSKMLPHGSYWDERLKRYVEPDEDEWSLDAYTAITGSETF